MLRFLLFLIMAYIGWKIYRIISRRSRKFPAQQPPAKSNTSYSFKNIQDAEFKDVSDRSPENGS